MIYGVWQLVDQEKIHNQSLSDDPKERIHALLELNSFFSLILDKQQAWDDLFRLTNDENSSVRSSAAKALGSAFSQVPDKQQAWNDLHRLIKDENSDERYWAADALGSLFSYMPDKQQAWNDLHKLTYDGDSFVRSNAASALGSAFSQVPDKQQAWNDLHRLIKDEHIDVRYWAADVLSSTFSQAPDKQQAWDDLHRLTYDENRLVRYSAVHALGSVFSQVPDKQQAWDDLHRLTNDEDSFVRSTSNHSFGRVSIFVASQAETDEDYKRELEKAIKFFETSAKEGRYDNPARFCLPFYHSFHSIIFKKQEAKEVNKYLEEAKDAIEGSESKKQLFEAVQNLAEALKEVQNMENLDLFGMKDELNFYRKYCDHASELMKYTDEKAPFATEVLRKGLPILDRNLKGIIKEIQEKAKNTYKQSQGTVTEEIAYSVCKEVQKWEIGSQEEMTFNLENLIFTLESKVPRTPANQDILKMIQQIKVQKEVSKQYAMITPIIAFIPQLNMQQELEEVKKGIKEINEKVDSISISLKPGITQEIEISSGIEIWGTGATLITTIPLQDISYAEIKEDLQRLKREPINGLSNIPKRLANKIKGYLLLKDREDIIDQLT